MSFELGPLRILVGVTGHLDPEEQDLNEIETKVSEEFHRLQSQWPSTSIVLLTGMAKGCDTIVTRVAISLGIEFVAILPMCLEQFRSDFSPSEYAELEVLLSKAKKVIVASNFEDDQGSIDRVYCYQRVGMMLASKSQILLALYNGVDTKKFGGTSEVIRFKLDGIPPHFWNDKTHDLLPGTGEVRVLSIRRKSFEEPRKSISWSTYGPVFDKNGKSLNKRFSAGSFINSFNQLVLKQKYLNKNWPVNTMLDTVPEISLKFKSGLSHLAYVQACADSLACFYRARIKRVIWYFFGIVFLTTSLFEIAENIPSMFLSFHIAGIIALSSIGFFWFFWKKNAWMDKEIDYRVLAEGLRVALYWRLSGINEPVADHYPSDPRGELDWVRRVLASEEILSESNIPPQRKFVEDDWFKGQAEWLHRKIHGDSKKIGFCQKIKLTKSLIGFLLVCITLIQVLKIYTHGFGELVESYSNNFEGWDSLGIIMALITGLRLPAVLGLTIAIFEIFGLEELVRQYERAKLVFQAGIKASESAHDSDFLKISLEVGKQALAENVEWAKIRRDRSLPEPNL